jgi:hypothetical protein
VAFTSHDRKQDLPRKTASQSSLSINRLIWMSQATRSIIRCAATTHALARARLSDFFEQIITSTF